MSYGSQFRGRRRVAQIFGQTPAQATPMPTYVRGARWISLAVSASYQAVLSVSGRGALNLVAVRGGTVGTLGLRVTVDGRQLHATSTVLSGDAGFCVIGSITGDTSAVYGGFAPEPIQFVSSALVEASFVFSSAGGVTPTLYLNYEVDV